MKLETNLTHKNGETRIYSSEMAIDFKVVGQYEHGEMPRLEGQIYTGDGRVVITLFDLAGGKHMTLLFDDENGLQDGPTIMTDDDDHPHTRNWGN